MRALSRKRQYEVPPMRNYLFLLAVPLVALVTLHAPAQADKPKYKVHFDTEQLEQALDGTPGIHVKVRFSFSQDGKKVDKLDGDYMLVIEENGKFVKKIDLTRPAVIEDLSVILALDTSGSMNGSGRMKQARDASAAFLK